ncbi:hypothetical protein [Bacillus sp. FSL K6-3431]|uniref:hypothetical protein n=1 Tax=Bacillus sp. FSL K6-3431 TaxID=2921500 RepID=UPI0030FAE2D3
MNFWGLVEIKVIMRKREVKRVLVTEGKLKAVKKCMDFTGWGLSKSKKYVDRIEVEVEKEESNNRSE